ncbi:DENN domain-containing protein 4C-like protein, partial [Dinothrombium tinctorium]
MDSQFKLPQIPTIFIPENITRPRSGRRRKVSVPQKKENEANSSEEQTQRVADDIPAPVASEATDSRQDLSSLQLTTKVVEELTPKLCPSCSNTLLMYFKPLQKYINEIVSLVEQSSSQPPVAENFNQNHMSNVPTSQNVQETKRQFSQEMYEDRDGVLKREDKPNQGAIITNKADSYKEEKKEIQFGAPSHAQSNYVNQLSQVENYFQNSINIIENRTENRFQNSVNIAENQTEIHENNVINYTQSKQSKDNYPVATQQVSSQEERDINTNTQGRRIEPPTESQSSNSEIYYDAHSQFIIENEQLISGEKVSEEQKEEEKRKPIQPSIIQTSDHGSNVIEESNEKREETAAEQSLIVENKEVREEISDDRPYAIVTIAYNNLSAVNAIILANSFRLTNNSVITDWRTSKKVFIPFIIFLGGTIDPLLRHAIEMIFDEVIYDQGDLRFSLLNDKSFGVRLHKLQLWKVFKKFEKCLFLESSTLVVGQITNLFSECTELSAAVDYMFPDFFNCAVFMFCPSLNTYENLMKFSVTMQLSLSKQNPDGNDVVDEMTLLNKFFADKWNHADLQKAAWESGRIDWMGAHKSDNIIERLKGKIGSNVMDEKRIVDYFVIAGLDNTSLVPLEEFVSRDGGASPLQVADPHSQPPITDITVIITSQGETVPNGYTCIDTTPSGFSADLNHGSIRSPQIFLCYRRGTDKPPLVDIGVLYESKERVMADSEVVHTTPTGKQANVNNSGSKTFLTYRRARDLYPCNQLVVTDICVILANKGETPPHAFCLINKTLNKGIYGSDVYVCYKKSMNRPPLLRYQPTILDRFPLDDYDCYSLPVSVPLFCIPMGATIECWPKSCPQPRPLFSTFVLTSDNASKVYGAAVTFYERYSESNLSEDQKLELGFVTEEDMRNKTLNVIKSICILSRWPFFDTFEKLLLFLYKTLLSSFHSPLLVPIERYISHFLLDIPFPSLHRPKILIQLCATSDETVLVSQPWEDMPLPLSGASFTEFLRNLGSDNCMNVLLLALAEQKILLHSLRPHVLTGVAEAVTSLIFPFRWQCPYIPLCPLGLCDVLNAPLPFIVGVDSRYFDMYEPPNDVICVDLDTNSIYLSEHKRMLNVKLLPKRPSRILKSTLEKLFDRLVNPVHKQNGTPYSSQTKSRISTSPFIPEIIETKKIDRQIDLEIQEAFIRFMASILRNFRSYLKPITRAPTVGATDPSSLFDFQNFLKSRDKTHQRFYQILMKTQMFTRFIEERSFASDKDSSLAFFDECLDKIEAVGDSDNAANIRLLESDESCKNDRTVFIPAPEPSSETYTYRQFGPLNPSLYHKHPVNYKKQALNGEGQDAESLSRSNLNFPISESPVSRRTKQEIRSAQKMARRHAESPLTWAKCLVSYCYSLWFIHLPAFVRVSQAIFPKDKPLRIAFEVLLRMHELNLHPPDELCYRMLMLLCGVYSQPTLAVKILFEMKRNGVTPNAITYGYYNKAVLESKWPSGESSASLMWAKLRNVIVGVSEFKKHGQLRQTKMKRMQSLSSGFETEMKDSTDIERNNEKRSTINQSENYSSSHNIACDSGDMSQNNMKKFLKSGGVRQRKANDLRIRTGSIVRTSSSIFSLEDYNSPAGVLMTSQSFSDDSVFNSLEDSIDVRRRHKSEDQNVVSPIIAQQRGQNSNNDLPSPKPYLRSYSFGNDARIIRNLKEGTLRALRHELERNHQMVPEEVDERIAGDTLEQISNNVYSNKSSSLKTINKEPEDSSEDLKCEIDDDIVKKSKIEESVKEETNALHTKYKNQSTDNDSHSSRGKNSTESDASSDLNTFSPIKEAFLNMNPFSPDGKVASSIRSSFRRLASNYQKSALARSTTFHSNPQHSANDKVSAKLSNMFRSKTLKVESSESPVVSALPRSATLPVSPSKLIDQNDHKSSTDHHEETTEQDELKSGLYSLPNSPWTSKIASAKHLEYVNSTLKSAANTMASRINGIRNSLASSASNSPSKLATYSASGSGSGSGGVMGTASLITQWASNIVDKFPSALSYDEDDCSSAHSLDFRRMSAAVSEDDLSERSRESSLALGLSNLAFTTPNAIHSPVFDAIEQHYSNSLDCSSSTTVLHIDLTSACRCYNCSSITFDEEIMEMWSADYSNLNTQCTYCGSNFVPLLTIILKFSRLQTNESQEIDSNGVHPCDIKNEDEENEKLKNHQDKNCFLNKSVFVDNNLEVMEPFTVPYLSPLVLRKEVENVLQHEGDICLTKSEFVDNHPIIYWNLIWYFNRINLPSHLRGLCLSSHAVFKNKMNIEKFKQYDYRNVVVHCLWDNEKLHEDKRRPMFSLWGETISGSSLLNALVTDEKRISQTTMRQILASIQANDLVTPIKVLVNERDLLFLSFVALGPENIDHLTFDREYRRAYESITSRGQVTISNIDKPPSVGAIFCRRFFKRLELKP